MAGRASKRSRFVLAVLGSLLLAPPVLAAVVTGRVLDGEGRAVSGAKVTWETYRTDEEMRVDETRGVSPAPLGETATDAFGRFRVTIDKPGVEVSIRLVPGLLPGVLLEGPYDSSEDVTLEDVELPAAEKVSGRVTDEKGKSISGAKIRALGSLSLREEGNLSYSEATSAADGSFSIPNAPAIERTLSVIAPGYVPVRRTSRERTSVERVMLKSGGSIAGTVLDATGQPAEGVIVTAGFLAMKTDVSGAFRLAGIPSGSQAVDAVWKDEFAARRNGLLVRKGETTEVSLRLGRAASVTGTVVDEKTRKAIAGVRVSAGRGMHSRGEEAIRKTRTDARGRFRIAGLLQRSHVVRASKADYLPVSMPGVEAGVSSPGNVAIALQKASSIAGRVTDEKGSPVAGARVRIPRDTGVRALLRAGGSPESFFGHQGVVTASDGTFRIRRLAAEKNLALEARKPGYATARRHGIMLKDGEARKDVALVLKRGLEARGRVVDAAGNPVARAEIRASIPQGFTRFALQFGGADREKPDTSSGTDGGFRLVGLEPGEYTLSVSREGFVTKRVTLVTVQAEGPNDWPPIILTAGVAIAGVVRNAQSQPVAGATVASFGEEPRPAETTSDPEGRFRLESLGAGRPVSLNVSAEGYAVFQRKVTPPSEELVIVLRTAGTIRGRVEDAATNRPITAFSASCGPPPAAAGIRIVVGEGAKGAFQSPDGAFELTNVPPGKWAVRASAPGYRPAEVIGVEVGEGETKEGIVLSLKRGVAVSGRVLEPRRGAGVPNAAVSWQEGSESRPGVAAMAMAGFSGEDNGAATDADGRFRFEGLPQGRVTLTAEHADYLGVSKQLEVEDGATVDLTLSAGGSISGTVVGKDGRSPIAGAQVLLDEQGSTFSMGSERARADDSGNFLYEHLKGARYRISAESRSGNSVPKEVVLAESQQLEGVLLEMATGALIKGTVTGLPAGQLGGLRVYAAVKDYNVPTFTDNDGHFSVRDMPAGVARVSAYTTFLPSRSVSKTVDIPEGATEISVDLAFEGSSRLAGRVTRGDKPLSGLYVFGSPDPPSSSTGRSVSDTDEEGRYALEGLKDGSYQVTLSGEGVFYRRVFTVSGDTNGDIALAGVSVSGLVTVEGSGEPIEGASVLVESGRESGTPALNRTVTDSRGIYSLEDMDAGNYQLTARKDGYQQKTLPLSIASSSVELNLSLDRGSGLAIRAVDGLTGLPLRGLVALAFAANGAVAFSGSVSLDSDGKGEISSLPPGRYQLYLYSNGYATRSFTVQVPSPPLAAALTSGGRLEIRTESLVTGRLVDASGSTYLPYPFRLDGRVHANAPVGVWNIAPGSYRFITTSNSGERSYPFTVTEGGTTTVEVQ